MGVSYYALFKRMCLMSAIVSVVKMFDTDHPNTIFGIQVLYGVERLVQFLLLAVMWVKIYSRAILATDKNIRSAKSKSLEFEKTKKEFESLTIKEYDMGILFKYAKQLSIQSAIVIGLHAWKGYVNPMAIQVAIGLYMTVQKPLVRVHLCGEKAAGKRLDRPFQEEENSENQMMEQYQDAMKTYNDAQDGGSGRAEIARLSQKSKKSSKVKTMKTK